MCNDFDNLTFRTFEQPECHGEMVTYSTSGTYKVMKPFRSMIIPKNVQTILQKENSQILYDNSLWNSILEDTSLVFDVWTGKNKLIKAHDSFDDITSITIFVPDNNELTYSIILGIFALLIIFLLVWSYSNINKKIWYKKNQEKNF